MGRKNKEKFSQLLDSIEDDRQHRDTGFNDSTTTTTTTSQPKTLYDADWYPRSDLRYADKLVRKIDDIHGVRPKNSYTSFRDKVGLAACVYRAKTGFSLKTDTDLAKSYYRENGQRNRIKVYASVFESYNIPWTVSEVKFINPDKSASPPAPDREIFLEFGVNRTSPPDSELRSVLEDIRDLRFGNNYPRHVQHSHIRNGVTYYPVMARDYGVSELGVFQTKDLGEGIGVMDDVRHEQVLKSGGV